MEMSFSVVIVILLVGVAISEGQYNRYGSYRNNRYSHGNSGYGNYGNSRYGNRYGNRYGYGHRRRCSPPSRPQYGGYDGDDDYYSIGHKVTYYCNDGYTLYGSEHSTCKYSSQTYRGYWDKPTPYCRPIKKKCPKLDNPENGAVQQSGVHPGDKATYSCNRGHNLVGSSRRKCQRNGQWSDSAPTCQPVDCGKPDAADANGAVRYDDTILGSTAYYTCNRGYILEGSATAKCLYTAKWSSGAPVCRPVNCGKPEAADANGAVRYDDTILDSTAYYTCNRGYILEGSATVVCLYTGKWSDGAPVCRPIDCENPDEADDNGSVRFGATTLGNTAYYFCNRGYVLVGSATVECLYTGEWSDNAPECRPIDCGQPEDSDPNGSLRVAGTTLGNTAYYSCNRGYILEGSANVVCLYTGKWSDGAPVCRPVDCGQPEAADANGAVRYDGTILDSTAYYTCNQGYILEGSATVVCLYTGQWSDGAPVCRPVDCGNPEAADDNGSVKFGATTLGNIATYSCNRGFVLVGSAIVECLYTGEWSDGAPMCRPVDCGPLNAPQFGNPVQHDPNTLFPSTATFSCRKGFKLVGQKVLNCLYTGDYDAEPPTCKRIRCPELKVPEYGSIHYSGYYPTDYVYYKCNYGYYLEGSKRRVCTYRGSWTGSDPTCVRDYHPYGDHYYHDDDDDYYNDHDKRY